MNPHPKGKVAVRKGRSRADRERDGERGGQRDGAAHPGPADRRRPRERRIRVAGADPREEEARQVRRGIDPDQPDRRDRGGGQRPPRRQVRHAHAREAVQDRVQLQADEHEEERVQDEGEDLPRRGSLQALLRVRQLRRAPAHVDAGRDDGEDARGPDRLRGEIREVAREQGDRRLDGRVVQPPPHRLKIRHRALYFDFQHGVAQSWFSSARAFE